VRGGSWSAAARAGRLRAVRDSQAGEKARDLAQSLTGRRKSRAAVDGRQGIAGEPGAPGAQAYGAPAGPAAAGDWPGPGRQGYEVRGEKGENGMGRFQARRK
jgi:hypothetical protein